MPHRFNIGCMTICVPITTTTSKGSLQVEQTVPCWHRNIKRCQSTVALPTSTRLRRTNYHLTTSAWPPPHAHIKQLEPNAESLSRNPAPASTKIFTTGSLPPPQAIISGVQSSTVRAPTLAGGVVPLRRSSAMVASPVAQATISGVRPTRLPAREGGTSDCSCIA